MESKPLITILMATYNGEKFIVEQLDSLIGQTHLNWRLIIRDDGSTDRTTEIIRSYRKRDNRISLMVNKTDRKGACANFSALLTYANSERETGYLMFSDQDDHWRTDKIEKSLAAIQMLEAEYPDQPALIYADFELMDSAGRPLPGKFNLKHQIRLNSLMIFNYVYGCTMIFNRQLADEVGDIPFDAENHDYWIALVASLYHSRFLNEKVIRYRQHTNNASGNVVNNNSLASRIRRLVMNPEKEISMSRNNLRMLKNFSGQYAKQLSQTDREMLNHYFAAFNKNRLSVVHSMLKYKTFKKGFFQSLSAFYQVIFFYNRIKTES